MSRASDDVCVDPDAYVSSDEDGTSAKTLGAWTRDARRVAGEDVDARRGTIARFEALLEETFPNGAIASVRWDRVVMKTQRDARFGMVGTHAERRAAFEAYARRRRDDMANARAPNASVKRRRDPEAEARALRAREAEAMRSTREAERVSARRKDALFADAADAAFSAMCAERVKTYTRSYEESFDRDLAGDPLGRDDVSKLRGGESRARELYAEHVARVERTLKTEFEKLARKMIDIKVVEAVSDDSALTEAQDDGHATIDSVFDGAISYRRAAEEDFELIDHVLFAFVSDEDKVKIWNACSLEILKRHGVKIKSGE